MGVFTPFFQFYLVKMDVFHHRAFKWKETPVLLRPDGVLLGPVDPQAKEVVALSS